MEDDYKIESSLDVTEPSAPTHEKTSGFAPQPDTEEFSPTVPDLKVLEFRSPAPDQITGFNPYNTVVKKDPSNKT
jgi:hypothetical protein